MSAIPDRLSESITIYRRAVTADGSSDRLFPDPFEGTGAAAVDQYSGYVDSGSAYRLARGTAVAQEYRVSVHRNAPTVRLEAASFASMLFVVHSVDVDVSQLIFDFGSLVSSDRVYLLREREAPNYLHPHIIVYWHVYSRGGLQLYTVDPREGHLTGVTVG